MNINLRTKEDSEVQNLKLVLDWTCFNTSDSIDEWCVHTFQLDCLNESKQNTEQVLVLSFFNFDDKLYWFWIYMTQFHFNVVDSTLMTDEIESCKPAFGNQLSYIVMHMTIMN